MLSKDVRIIYGKSFEHMNDANISDVREQMRAALGKKFVCHIAVDRATDAAKVKRVLKKL